MWLAKQPTETSPLDYWPSTTRGKSVQLPSRIFSRTHQIFISVDGEKLKRDVLKLVYIVFIGEDEGGTSMELGDSLEDAEDLNLLWALPCCIFKRPKTRQAIQLFPEDSD